MKLSACIVCGQEGEEGLHILGNMICAKCEQGIMTADALDAQYGAFVERLRSVVREAV